MMIKKTRDERPAKARRHPTRSISKPARGAIAEPPKPMPAKATPIASPLLRSNQFETSV
jgi:hypothetical protein